MTTSAQAPPSALQPAPASNQLPSFAAQPVLQPSSASGQVASLVTLQLQSAPPSAQIHSPAGQQLQSSSTSAQMPSLVGPQSTSLLRHPTHAMMQASGTAGGNPPESIAIALFPTPSPTQPSSPLARSSWQARTYGSSSAGATSQGAAHTPTPTPGGSSGAHSQGAAHTPTPTPNGSSGAVTQGGHSTPYASSLDVAQGALPSPLSSARGMGLHAEEVWLQVAGSSGVQGPGEGTSVPGHAPMAGSHLSRGATAHMARRAAGVLAQARAQGQSDVDIEGGHGHF